MTTPTPVPTTPPPTVPPLTTPPPLATTPWLPQCTIASGGTGYTVLSRPAASSSSPQNVNTGLTGQEFLASTGFDPATLKPMPLPVVNDTSVTGASLCPNNVNYIAGPTASRTTCYLVSCFGQGCFTCSGTFVADPTGQERLLFMTATHCVARTETDLMVLTKSFVSCDRDAGIDTASNGVFEPVAVAMSKIDFAIRYGLRDGSLIQVLALADTRLGFALPVAVGAVTTTGLTQSVPNFSAGFPQIDDSRFEGCNAVNLGNPLAIHFSRVISTRTLTSSGLQIPRLSACGGNSGGTMIDEQACVLFGVLSASSISCVAGTSSNYYSRIVASATENGVPVEGVPFLALAGGLISGQVVFVN